MLEAAGGGYPDRDVRNRRDNHCRILSEARGPEAACQHQKNCQQSDQRRTVLPPDPGMAVAERE
jgi:hypothetical protein